MKLIQKFCKICHDDRYRNKWNFVDDILWRRGRVLCFDRKFRDMDRDNVPMKCPYRVEQLVSQ
jgi:hypothetical protein